MRRIRVNPLATRGTHELRERDRQSERDEKGEAGKAVKFRSLASLIFAICGTCAFGMFEHTAAAAREKEKGGGE